MSYDDKARKIAGHWIQPGYAHTIADDIAAALREAHEAGKRDAVRTIEGYAARTEIAKVRKHLGFAAAAVLASLPQHERGDG